MDMLGLVTTRIRSKPGNLPAALSGLVDRRRELADLKRLLESSRMVTLLGIGGIGKTRLALAVAHELSRAFPDGVWVVNLAPLTEPALLEEVIESTLGLRDQGSNGSAPSGLAGFLAERQVLLVLDNCDRLVEACADCSARYSGPAPTLRSSRPARRGSAWTESTPSLCPRWGHPTRAVRVNFRRSQAQTPSPCSRSGRRRCCPASSSTATTAKRWWNSASASTAFLWPSSLPPLEPTSSPRSRWSNGWLTVSSSLDDPTPGGVMIVLMAHSMTGELISGNLNERSGCQAHASLRPK